MIIARSLFWSRFKKPALSGCCILGVGGAYFFACQKAHKIQSETIRAGISGSISALTVELLCHAVDTVNMRAKVEKSSKSIVPNFVRVEGARALFRGVNYVYYGYAPPLFLYYVMYHKTKECVRKFGHGDAEGISSTFAAALSEFLFVCMIYPVELVKTRAQVSKCAQVQKNGLKSLLVVDKESLLQSMKKTGKQGYTGFLPHLATYVTFVGFQFGIYNALVHVFRKYTSSKEMRPPLLVILGSSLVSAIVASIVSNPFEVLTVINQTQKPMGFKGLLNKELWFRGIAPRIMYNTILSCALFFLLEYSSTLFNVQFSH